MNVREYTSKILENTSFTQEQIADYLQVDQSMISKWKKMERPINPVQFEKLCNMLGHSMSDYLNGNTNNQICIAFRAKELKAKDIRTIVSFNTIFSNLLLLGELFNDEQIQ